MNPASLRKILLKALISSFAIVVVAGCADTTQLEKMNEEHQRRLGDVELRHAGELAEADRRADEKEAAALARRELEFFELRSKHAMALASMMSELHALAQRLKDVEAAAADAKDKDQRSLAALQAAIAERDARVQDLSARLNATKEDLAALEQRLAGAPTGPADVAPADPPPPAAGEVVIGDLPDLHGMVIDAVNDLIEVSLGTNDGLDKGMNLEVYRVAPEPKYLGRIVIVQVAEDRAVGRIVWEFKRGDIQRGDWVATRL